MNKLFVSVLILFLSLTNIIGQDLDSLAQEIKIQKDTTQVKSLILLGRKLRRSNPDSSLVTLGLAIQKAEKIGYYDGQMRAFQTRGVAYGMKHDYAKAILDFNEAVNLGTKYKKPGLTADAYNGLGIVYKRIGDYVSSLKYYNESLKIYKENGIINGEATTYANLGVLYDLMDELDESYKFYNYALNINDSLHFEKSKYSLLTNIAIYHIRKKEYSKAINLLKTNVKYYDSIQENYRLTITYNTLSYANKQMKNYDAAIYYSTKAIHLANNTSNKLDGASAYLNRAESYLKKGDTNNALADAKVNFELSKSLGYSKLLESYDLLASVYEAKGNYKAATESRRIVARYKDSLFEENKVQQYKAEQVKQQVYDKNLQIESQKRNIDLLNLQVELERKWNIFLGVIAVLFLLLIALLFQKYSYRKKTNTVLKAQNELISKQKKEIELINQELENRMLRAQINPHFIFNALNSIQHFITENDKLSTLKYLTKFSSLLRQILENSINAKVSIADEVKYLKIYIDLEALRFDYSFNYNFNIEEGLNLHDIEVPILFLQPFVENAILHGLLPKQGEKNLTISIYQKESYVQFEIEDNGIGRKEAALLKSKKQIKHKSRGLSVTQQRIKMLQKDKKENPVKFVDLYDKNGQPSGTKIIIKIPVENS